MREEKDGRGEVAGIRRMAVLVILLTISRGALARDSWQVWMDQVASKALSDKSSLRAGQSFRYSCDEERLETYFIEAGFSRRFLHWLESGLAYRQQFARRGDHWLEENRPYVDVTVQWRNPRVTLSDRNRLEYRGLEGQDDSFRYRNKAMLHYNKWEPPFGLKPYVAVEAFMDDSVRLNERNRTRLTFGIRTDPERGLLHAFQAHAGLALAMDYYVMVQRAKKDGRWMEEYVAGAQLGAQF